MPTSPIRPVRSGDLDAVYQICLQTADAGNDAAELHDDPRLPGHVWAAPYVLFEPAHGFVVVDHTDQPIGYCLGALDSRAYEARLERNWWPELRSRYPLESDRRPADQESVWFIHHPPIADATIVTDFPSHLHVDLLPAAQGQGAGRRLIATLLRSLASDGSTGVHLGVDARNERAIGFYEALGFARLPGSEHGTTFTKQL